jgi:hypothetical protein
MIVDFWDNALNEKTLNDASDELLTLNWEKHFDRVGSNMFEANDIKKLPILKNLYVNFSEPNFLNFIEKKIGIDGILPDPHLIGAGYSQIKDSGDLKPHIDFNWNNKIKLYRVATFIIYLSDPDSGGEIEFIDFGKYKIKKNRAILFSHSETIRHFVHPVKGIRNTVRFFYYASRLNPPKNYHRSLYGLKNGNPVDIK